MVLSRISNTLSHAMQRRQHRSFSRLLVAAVMVIMVVLAVTVFALSSGSPALASRPGRTIGEPKLSLIARRIVHQVNIPLWHGKSGFGFALVGSAPAGIGSSITAIDEATNTIYVANGNNPNGPDAGGNTVSVLNGAICNAQITSGCNQMPATVPVGNHPVGIFADETNHTVYIANFSDNTVSLLNSSTCNGSHLGGCPTTPPLTVAIPNGPGDVDVNQTTHTAYVATLTGMSVFDANTCNASTTSGCSNLGTANISCVGSTNPGLCGPFTAKVDEANNTVYESDADNRVSVFDGQTCNASDLVGCAAQTPGTVIVNGGAGFEVSLWIAVDAPLHSVYVSNQKDDYLAVIDTNICNGSHLTACATLKPPTIHTGSDPEIIAINQKTQTVYAPNQVDNNVSVINALLCNAANTSGCDHPAPQVNITNGVSAIAVDAAFHTAYVANAGANTVSMLNTRKCNASSLQGCGTALPTVPVGVSPSGVAVNTQTHTVYVANFGSGASGTVSVINATTCNATHSSGCTSVQVLQVPGGNPTGIAINQATDTIYVATVTSSVQDIVSVFNGATCNASHSLGCTQTPAVILVGSSGGSNGSELSLVVNQKTNTIYATNLVFTNPFMGNSVYMINGATCDATNTSGCGNTPATITAGNNPWGIDVDEATDTIYTANIANGEGPGTVSVINGAICNGSNMAGCGQITLTVSAGFGAGSVAIDNATNTIYVTNIQDTSVSVINGSTCNAIKTAGCGKAPPKVAVGLTPFAAAVDQGVATVYVASLTGTLSVIPTSQ